MLLYLLSISEEDTKPNIIKLYAAHKDSMLRIASKRLHTIEDTNYANDAQDVVQNTFVKVVRYINAFPRLTEREQQAYLYAILNNELNNYISEYLHYNNESYELTNARDKTNFIEALEIKDRYDAVVDAIYELDEKYSTAMLFRYAKNFSVKKIAQLLGVSRDVVYMRLSRGRAQLLAILKEKEIDE